MRESSAGRSALSRRRAGVAGVLALILVALGSPPAGAEVYPGSDALIGGVVHHEVQAGDSLFEIARRFDLGIGEIIRANPGVNPFVPTPGSTVVVPTAWLLPTAARTGDGITVNLAEPRLYYAFHSGGVRLVATFPVGIGDEGWATPLGNFRVVEKITRPAWHVPRSIREVRPDLPAVVPPGPENPLGSHALRLSEGSILIHGTPRPWGVGRRVSHGCIRLYPEDIRRLFDMVPLGTPVTVVREPVRVGAWGGRVYAALGDDPAGGADFLPLARRLLAAEGLADRVDPARLQAALAENRGYPVDVSR